MTSQLGRLSFPHTFFAALALAACTSGTAGSPPGDLCTAEPTTYEGEATYYAADGSGNCSFPATPGDLAVGAMNHTDYANSAACGACAAIEGPDGSVTVRIVDRCPECAPGDIDLSPEAFAFLAPLSEGRVPIRWRYVPCETSGPIVYHFKEGSNAWWVSVQIRNHRHPIARFEVLGEDGAFRALERVEDNYFLAADGLGPGPFTFRTTDVTGSVVTDSSVPLLDDADHTSASQFAACEAP